jgi:predicted permease
VTTFYRALLRLYPSSFRADYGAELARTFEEQMRDRSRAGRMLAAIADVIPNALAAHREILAQDLRYAARTIAGARGFAVGAILVTALGVGANAATFSVAEFVLLRPLPYPEPDTLVRLCEGPRTGGGWGCMNQLSPANYRDVAAMNKSLSALGAFQRSAMNLVGRGEPVRVSAALVTTDVLPLLGVHPVIGRAFDSPAAGDADGRTAIIGFGFWQSHFGGDPSVVGTSISLDGTPHVVIGVMPRQFRFPSEDVQLWVPFTLREADFANRRNRYLDGVARLGPGVTFEQARTDMATIAARLAQDHPDTNAEVGFSFFRQRDEMSPRYRTLLLALCGASLCLLLLTCASLANLFLARATSRERELAVRAALGAGRERLIRQMLTDSAVLALVGGAAGALVAALAIPLLTSLVPPTLPIAAQPTLDWRVLGFATAFAAITAMSFGLVPALRVGGSTGFNALREGARGGQRTRLRTALVVIEVAVSVVLLMSSGLLVRAMWRVQAVDPGFGAEAVLTMQTALSSAVYADPLRRSDFYRRVTAEVRALPGVESAAYTSGLPMVMTGGITRIMLAGEEERDDGTQNASLRIVTPEFFSALRIPLRLGRDLSESDTRESPLVAVVSESFARRHWPDAEPIGRTFETRGQLRTVVGVVGNIKVRGPERTSEPQLYIPAAQAPNPIGALYLPKDLVVRLSRQDPGLVEAIREIVRRVDPQQPVANVRMLSEVVGDQTETRRVQLRVLVALAVLALLITAAGIHGLLGFTVAQRDREIGVRLALGANRSSVARMIMSEGVRIALIGVAWGTLVAYGTARGMSTLLFGVPPDDLVTILLVALICFVTTVAASAWPALRAAGIQPMAALRAD